MKLGCDIVSINRFSASLQKGGEEFIERVFSPAEYEGATLERLAGIFAAKEAACKALFIPGGNWRAFHVSYQEKGAPQIEVQWPSLSPMEINVSISHDGDYAFAVVLVNDSHSL